MAHIAALFPQPESTHDAVQGYHTLQPGPALRGIVEALWLYDGYSPPHSFESVLPSGTVEIVFNLAGKDLSCYHPETMQRMRRRSPVVTGVHRRHFVIDTEQQRSIMGIGFSPAGAWRWLGIPPDEIADRHVELEALLGPAARHWQQVLEATSGPAQRLRLLHELLAAHPLREAHPAVEWAAEQICRYPEAMSVQLLAMESDLSTRRFHDLFSRQVGIAPKGFIRIRRFQAALAAIRASGHVCWSALAASTGYADQSHLIRDFKTFTGMTPTAYAAIHQRSEMVVPRPEQDQICPFPGGLTD